jgi:hypothetical protein
MEKLSKEELVLLKNYMHKLEQINHLNFRVSEAYKIIEFLDEKDDWSESNYDVIERFKKKTEFEKQLSLKPYSVPVFNFYNHNKNDLFREFTIINSDCKFNPLLYIMNPYYKQSLILSKKYHQLLKENNVGILKRSEFAIKYRELIMQELSNGIPIKEAVKVIKIKQTTIS